MTAAALLLAAALLISGGPVVTRGRAGHYRRWHRFDAGRRDVADPFAMASALDVLAVCLSAGMAVSTAAAATAPSAPAALGAHLRRAAELLAMGADPEVAWSAPASARRTPVDDPCEALMRLARRSASSGSALAQGVVDLAEKSRRDVTHAALAAGERAGVLIAGPLGLCFLPAFVCLGIVPVVGGLAGDVFGTGLL